MNEAESEVFWWLVSRGGEWVRICRQHHHCLRTYQRRLEAAKRLAGGCGVYGSPLRGERGRYDIEATYEGGRYYFRWIPHPELVKTERRAQEQMRGVRVPDDREERE